MNKQITQRLPELIKTSPKGSDSPTYNTEKNKNGGQREINNKQLALSRHCIGHQYVNIEI